jgi:hypothetical protein
VYVRRDFERESQYVFRRANERLLAAVSDRVDGTTSIPFLCECADPACRGTVDLSIAQFRALREQPSRFVIVTGHSVVRGELIVETDGDVTIVEKN